VKLIEVNCHSLFSKWFSESGKQIKEMFDDVRKLASAPGAFVCILIDEIESISISRTSLFKGSEPSDSIRAVNVLLTQIDQIRELPNVLILATSNLPETVDMAFMDRVDRKFQLGPPSHKAKREILFAGIRELIMKGMVEDFHSHDLDCAIEMASGRLVRKLPFLALAESLNRAPFPIPSDVFLDELSRIASENQESVYE
jgi:SpoVK/Ycf46/Vps4 family AAA+-type ATPase